MFTSLLTCTVLYLTYKFSLNTDLFIVVGLGKNVQWIFIYNTGWVVEEVFFGDGKHIWSFKNTTWISTNWNMQWRNTLKRCAHSNIWKLLPKNPRYASCLLKTFINRKIWIISTFLQRAVTETDLTLYLHRG